MKELSSKLSAILIITILILGTVFYACSNEDLEKNINTSKLKTEQDIKIPLDMGGLKIGSLILPKGTISKISQNGSRLDYKLPENYIYAATDEFGNVFFADSGSYTCTSTCEGGCDVAKLGENVGCSACPEGSTAPCTGKRGASISQRKNGLKEHQIGDGFNGGIINLEYGISFITNESKNNKKYKSLNLSILRANSKIESEFELFVNNIWKDKVPSSDGAKEVLVDVYGKVISLYIPNEMYSRGYYRAGENVSCGCSSGSSGCVLEDIKTKTLFPIVIGKKCVAGACTSCTMSWTTQE